MKKVISLFQRNYEGNRLVRDEVVPGAEWVTAGEGVATRKYDGTSCLVLDGKLFKRYDAKHGKIPPANFLPAQEPDAVTGHWPGWLPVTEMDYWHLDAMKNMDVVPPDGTYELVGPKINNNRDGFNIHILIKHGVVTYPDAPRTFIELKVWLAGHKIEGVVWHHPDGRMVKIKRKDFGLNW